MPTSDLAEVIALCREEVAYSIEQCDQHTMVDNRHLTALLDAAEAGLRARRVALEDAKAALKDLWFGDEVARPGSLDAIEAIDALIAASPICNDNLQVQTDKASVKFNLTVSAAEAGARDAALEEAARIAEAIDPEKPANWLHARHKIAFEIRALRARAQEIDDGR